MTIRCYRLEGAPGKPTCCQSCHDDEEIGYALSDSTEDFEVCCRVNHWLQHLTPAEYEVLRRFA